MLAITIKFAGPTNTKGPHMIAIACAGRETFSYRYELDNEQNAIEAAKAYAKSKGWSGKMAIGQDVRGDWQAVFIKEWTEFEVV